MLKNKPFFALRLCLALFCRVVIIGALSEIFSIVFLKKVTFSKK